MTSEQCEHGPSSFLRCGECRECREWDRLERESRDCKVQGHHWVHVYRGSYCGNCGAEGGTR